MPVAEPVHGTGYIRVTDRKWRTSHSTCPGGKDAPLKVSHHRCRHTANATWPEYPQQFNGGAPALDLLLGSDVSAHATRIGFHTRGGKPRGIAGNDRPGNLQGRRAAYPRSPPRTASAPVPRATITGPLNRKASPQEWMVSPPVAPPPLRSRTAPKASGPANAPINPIGEWPAMVAHDRAHFLPHLAAPILGAGFCVEPPTDRHVLRCRCCLDRVLLQPRAHRGFG